MKPTDGIEKGESEFTWCHRHYLQTHFPPTKPQCYSSGKTPEVSLGADGGQTGIHMASYLVACPSVSMMRGHLSQWVMTAAF